MSPDLKPIEHLWDVLKQKAEEPKTQIWTFSHTDCLSAHPSVSQVYCVPIGGMLVRQPVSVGGSGSTYIYGFMDSNYKPGLSKDQCLELTAAALSLAMERDGSSGGVVRLASISEEGVERRVILGNQLPKYSTH
ncbi:proteasome subunit beta type-6-like [Micropterus salmoides]|uniref:proteasome subunit beta type-6-like n=1 Tax=Micropterus salmoides TaxID=27706 RepID=UPI0018EB877D|nr:proteasome subunit beta type-6-like [Micropterus salmoides]